MLLFLRHIETYHVKSGYPPEVGFGYHSEYIEVLVLGGHDRPTARLQAVIAQSPCGEVDVPQNGVGQDDVHGVCRPIQIPLVAG